MEQSPKTLAIEGLDSRKLIGWIIIAVILGEAVWNLIVSVMNNLVVPWLGDVMGASSGLPTSFIQRPYDYPALFVSVLESCIAGMVAAILNYFLQRKRAGRVRAQKIAATTPLFQPERIIPRTAAPEVRPEAAPPVEKPEPVAPRPSVPVVVPDIPAIVPAPVIAPAATPAAAAIPAPVVPSEPAAKSIAAQPQPQVAKAAPPAPIPAKPAPAKPKKSKPVYYNIVGEPMPDDE